MNQPFLNQLNTILAVLAVATGLSLAGDLAETSVSDEPDSEASCHRDHHSHDSLAPVGVMGDHVHEAGESMLSYRFMTMTMSDNYVGDNRIADTQVISPSGGGYLVTPTEMTTDRHMIGGMYAPTDELTLMLMVPFLEKSMDHLRRDGVRFSTGSEGIGDVKFSGLFKFFDAEHQRAHFNLGLSLPTGSTDEEGFVPGPGNTRLPYPMQLGSGTWDLLPGVTWHGHMGDLSWGAQFLANIRLGTNGEGYQLGNVYTGNLWLAYQLCDCASTSIRVTGSGRGNIDGRDRNLVIPGAAVPTADADLHGGERIDVFGGINLYGHKGAISGHRLAIEAGGTVWQDLDGPQLGMDWMLIVGWQKAF